LRHDGSAARRLGALGPLPPPRVQEYGLPLRACASSALRARPAAAHRQPWSSSWALRTPSSVPTASD